MAPENDDASSAPSPHAVPKPALAQEAEEQAAAAEARAAAARARAAALRRQADDPGRPGKSNSRANTVVRAGIAAAVVAICGFVALSGYLAWQHRALTQESARHAEYAAIARQGVVNLMTLDPANAEENVQSIIDSATGDFKEEFEAQADMLAQSLAQSEISTEVTVNSVAVEADADDGPVVLVAATTRAAGTDDARREPQRIRAAVTLAEDGGEFKIAQVEFV